MSDDMGRTGKATLLDRPDLPMASSCPICGVEYISPSGFYKPTCGKPDCIRKARDQGLPVALVPRIPTGKRPRKPRSSKSKAK